MASIVTVVYSHKVQMAGSLVQSQGIRGRYSHEVQVEGIIVYSHKIYAAGTVIRYRWKV